LSIIICQALSFAFCLRTYITRGRNTRTCIKHVLTQNLRYTQHAVQKSPNLVTAFILTPDPLPSRPYGWAIQISFQYCPLVYTRCDTFCCLSEMRTGIIAWRVYAQTTCSL
jgi:hypothetical protein